MATDTQDQDDWQNYDPHPISLITVAENLFLIVKNTNLYFLSQNIRDWNLSIDLQFGATKYPTDAQKNQWNENNC